MLSSSSISRPSVLSVWEQLGAPRAFRVVECFEEEAQVEIQRRAEITSGGRIQAYDRLVHEIGVEQARRCEIGRGRVEDVVVDPSHVPARFNGVSGEDDIGSFPGDGVVGAEEAVGEAAVLEEAAGDVHFQLTTTVASIDEEVDRERRFRKGSEIAGRNEGEVGVSRN